MAPLFESRLDSLRKKFTEVVSLNTPYSFRPIHEGRPAAVLLLWGLRNESDSIEILMTKRTDKVDTHKGQYALPGGMQDFETEPLVDTALRETEEEMGISRELVEVFGMLPPLWTPSGFLVTPVLGLLKRPIEIRVVPSPSEIASWFWCGLDRLRDEGVYSSEAHTITISGLGHSVTVDVFQVGEHRIWGATGAMLRNFIERLSKVESSN
jgi:8-oxo-dGTP pyrophosphatase MutT (NUDIX family)